MQIKKNDQKDFYCPSTSLGGYMLPDPSNSMSFNSKNFQQYNKLIRPPQLQQNALINQTLSSFLPQPMLPQFFYPSSYPPLTSLDPAKYPFSDTQALFNTAASVGFPPNKEAMFPSLPAVKGWPMISFDSLGNPIPFPRMYGKFYIIHI